MNVYLDNAATTQVHPKVLEAMLPFLKENFGNPSSIHQFGRNVKVELENAREIIAGFINADPGEIYFTSGGTEAINFILHGIAKTEISESGRKIILSSQIEHHAVLETLESLDTFGIKHILLPPDSKGKITPEKLKNYLSADTSLISLMHVNNEIGCVNPIPEITSLAGLKNILVFSDCVQSFGKYPIDVKKMGIDAMSASAHKIYGPKGVGFAYVKSGTPMNSFLHGGSQERNRRGGTENVAGIIGLAEAAKIAHKDMESNFQHVKALKEFFLHGMMELDKSGIFINGDESGSPYILSISFNSDMYNIDSEAMLIYLDINGVAVSNGSACNSGTVKASHVIKGIGREEKDAQGTLRFSFGIYNTEKEIEYVLETMRKFVKQFIKKN